MANTSANTRPPVTANALKAQAFYRLSWDFRDGEWWVPALYSLSSAGPILVNLTSKIHVLVKSSQKPLLLSLPATFVTVTMLSIGFLLQVRNFSIVL